jgi:hypothetical protein
MINWSKHFNTLGLVCLLALVAVHTTQASISVSQSIDRTDMAFEDTANFRVTVSWTGPAHAYRFEKAFRLQSDRMKVARFSSSVRSSGAGPGETTTKIFDYQLTPALSGIATVQPMVIEYVTWPDSSVGQLLTDAVTVSVAEPKQAKVGKGEGMKGGLIALIAVIVLGLGVGLYLLLRPKAKKVVTKSPAEVFLEQLELTRKDAGMDLKKFQTGVSRCLMMYVQARYGIDLAGQSASQSAIELEKVESTQAVREALSGWLARAEREKFSPLASAPGEVPRLESEIRTFFEKLK